MLSYDKHQNRSPYLFLQAIRTRKLYMLYMEGHKKTNKSRLSKVCNKSFGQLVCNNTPKPNLKIISNEILNNHLNKTNEDHTDFHDDFVLSQEISGSGVSSSKKLKSTKLQSIHLNISEHKSPKTETPQKVREEEENDALKEQGTSPVLGSALSKYESCKGFLASTPANLSNVSSSENRKSDFVLNILDRLCSPILGKRSVGTSDKSQIKSNQPKSSSLRPSKRLFSDTFDSNFPEPKRNKECNTLKKTENDSDASDDDPFKVHDISEHTLQALCEATDHIVDHLEVEEVSDTTLKKYSYQIKNRHSSSHKSQKSTSMNVAHLPNRNNRNQKCFSDEKNETLNKLVNNSSLIYRNCLSSLDTFRKLSVTDLLIPVKILEEAKNPINNNSICNQNHLLNNGIKSQSLSSYNLMKSCTKGKTKELNLYPDLKKTSESVISKNELMNVDDSLIITDTQYCELVDAAEMVSDFDETFTEFFEERRNYLKNNTVDSKKYPSEVNNFHMKSVQEGGCDELPNSLSKTVSETQKVLFPSRQKNSAKVTFIEESLKTTEQFLKKHTHKEKLTLEGFQTAGSKNVKIPQDQLERELFDREEMCVTPKCSIIQSASDNGIQVSEDSLKIAKQKFYGEEMCDAPQCNGFKTAAGKTVKISEESLKKAKQLLDCEEPCKVTTFLGFQTAGGKPVKIAEESLNKAKQLFDGEDIGIASKPGGFQTGCCNVFTSEESLKREKHLVNDEELCQAKLEQFQTAIGETVKISEESLKEAKQATDVENTHIGPKFDEFTTAGGKTVKVSEESLKKAKELFVGEETCVTTKFSSFQSESDNKAKTLEDLFKRSEQWFYEEGICDAPKFDGFKTAASKSVKISEESLIKAKELLDCEEQCKVTTFLGFQTAGGNTVKVSEESLNKAKQLFDGEDIEIASKSDGFQTGCCNVFTSEESVKREKHLVNHEELYKAKLEQFQPAIGETVKISEVSLKKAKKLIDVEDAHIGPKFGGFQTAGGKTVEISEQSLMKEKQLFGEDDIVTASKFDGFQIAGGKAVKISEQSLKKAKQLFGEDDIVTDSKFDGFQTAGGKTVKISEQSLKKAKQLFGEDDIVTASKFDGFQTAGGKTVKISEQSLMKAKQLLGEDDIVTASKFDGFQTAGGKAVKISEQPLKKAKQLFGEDDIVTASKFDGFQTAGGKAVKISEQSLKKAKQLFGEDDIVTDSKFDGFQTAGGKTVKISEQSLMKAKQLLGEDDIVTDSKFDGFQTAGGKAVKISEQSLKKAKQLFGEDDIVTDSKFNGFQTAGGKTVKISEQSLKKAKQLFGEDDIVTASKFDGFQTAGGKTVKISEQSLMKAKQLLGEDDIVTASKFDGFQTAGGKAVKISEQSLKKAKQLFGEDDIVTDSKFDGFQTAGGKTVKISEQSLMKAKQLFGEDDIVSASKFDGFQTAGGKTVEISEQSLMKEKQLFGEDDIVTASKFHGFQTAGGKAVKISEQSLKKAKQLLGEDDIVTATKFHGFQTAGGKAVKISEQSLMKAKQLLGEDDIVTASKFDGFQTAGGKAVKISEQSLKKAKQLFGEDDIVTDSNFDGFQTAGGKTVEISEQSLKKAKQLFGEDDIVSASKLDGFQTAGGKTVKTSEESIKRAKQLFDCEEQGKFLKLKGFQTAGGKTVEISEESLQKAKQLFDGDEMDIAPQFDGLETTCGNTVLITRDALKSKQMHLNELCNDPAFEDHQNGSAKEALNISNQNVVPCSSREFHLMDNSFSEIADKSDNIKHFVNCEIYPIKAIDTDPEVKKNCILQTYKKSVSKLKKKCRENDESNTDIVNPPKKPRKLFEGIELHNIHNTLNNHSPVTISLNSSNLCSSVISEEDLNLLNQSAIKTSSHISSLREIGSENYNIDIPEKNFVLSPNVAREVSESMAALMADEESSSPFSKSLLKPCLSSPSMVFDRQLKLPPIDCFEGDVYINDKQLSPVLGSFSNLKNAKCCKKGLQSPDKKSTPKINSVSFNLPYVTSTPNEATIRSKNIQSNHKCLESVIEENENEWKFCNKASIVELEIARKKAGDDQENLIKEKLKLSKSIRSCKGSYLLRKQVESGRSLKSLGELKHLQHKELNQLRLLGIKRTVIDVSASNAVDFRFFARDYYSEDICSSNVDGIPLGDSALLILAGDGTAGVVEITRAFLASPNVDPSLVSQEWVRNHYRWIVLKMAATERMFPENLANKYLTPDNLMFQLKYRYDREIDMCQRSALRKILEKDESSSKPMVLFVADILNVSDVEGSGEKEGKELVLSDGWYSVTASIDREMSLMVRRSVVRVGTKLLVVGADLVNNEDGCHPLETPANVRLRIWTNSTRRARWYARLGFCRHVPPPARLEKVLGRGGTVPALSSTVARTYPLLFLEKLPDGKTVIRGERAEQTAGDAYQLRRQQCAETILSQLQSETDAGASRSRRKQHSVTRTSLKHVTNTRELLSLLEGVEDISIFQEVLTKDQLNVIQEHRQEEASRLQQQLQDKLIKRLDEKIAPRVVTRMLKVRLVDEEKQSNRSAMLTVWNPSDDVMSLLTEGNVLTFHNLTASGYSRYGDLQLTSSRQTRYSLHRHSVLPRQVTPLSALHDAGYMPQFSEVDVVGLVLPRNDVAENSRLLYVSDANYNFLGISFCMDVKDTGFAHILTPGSVICASNLHWSCNRVSWSLPSVFATEVSSFSQHPRQKHLHEALQQLKERLSSLDSDTYRDECVKRIKSLIAQRNSGGSAQTSATTPTVSSVPITSSSSNEKSTTVVANSKLHSASLESCDTPTSRKLAWLEQFGEPPPLSPLALSTPTRLKRSFRPPKKNIDESR